MVALIRLAAGAALLLTLVPAVAAEGFRGSYRDGLEALGAERWESAVAAFRAAIEDRPEEAQRVPGTLFRRTPYLPYFHLGVALVRLGDCPAALGAFAESERQGVVRQLPEYEELRRRREDCRAQLARISALEKAQDAAARAETAAAALRRMRDDPELATVWAWRGEALSQRIAAALELLERAQRELEGGQTLSLDRIQEAGETASRAYWQLEAVRAEATQHLADVRELVAEKRSELEGLVATGQRLLGSTARLSPFPPGLKRRRDELSRLLGDALMIEATPAQLAERARALEAAIGALERAAAPPPSRLRRAARAYFSGEYAEVLSLLPDPSFSSREATAQAHLFRSAAAHALWRAGGEAEELLETSRTEAAAALASRPELVPPSEYFSPAFIEFFVSVREDSD